MRRCFVDEEDATGVRGGPTRSARDRPTSRSAEIAAGEEQVDRSDEGVGESPPPPEPSLAISDPGSSRESPS